ncbi:MAG: quinone-dependent dihydroorotate dehydrogenase [Proteobacteria bacterium]|nr:quinone-dependent dihydroorotate dehydrogenase [Pseudomonadota bacterium]
MSIYQIFRPLIFKIDLESAHNLAINFLKFCPRTATIFSAKRDYENLRSKLWDLDFTSPIGMAAGFDKNAEVATTLEKFGFGFVECGTVTPKAQTGNDRPRIFRLEEDLALINRLGFNNLGAEVFEKNLPKISVPLGINIGKNKDTEEALHDYLPLLEKFYQKASYITVNISSPNTKNLRDLQNENQLDLFLSEIAKKKNELKNTQKKNTPILLKVAPDLSVAEQEKIAETVIKNKIDGMVISNTTIDRDLNLKSKNAAELGGLSGAPLLKKSNEVLKNFYKFTEGKIPLIGVGGISSAQDVYEKIKCGASLVQIYSAFIYQGFGLVEEIKKELSKKIVAEGLKNISELVGAAH